MTMAINAMFTIAVNAMFTMVINAMFTMAVNAMCTMAINAMFIMAINAMFNMAINAMITIAVEFSQISPKHIVLYQQLTALYNLVIYPPVICLQLSAAFCSLHNVCK